MRREPGPELAVVVPTYDERENVRELHRRLELVLAGERFELIFVDDDSPDGTADVARELAREDARVRVLQRVGRRGLASACIEGAMATSAPLLVVMDGDLQHDETLLPRMLEILRCDEADLVVASRYVDGGGVGEWAADRAGISRWATRLIGLIVPRAVTDPLSGFFMVRRELFAGSVRGLSSMGFKILADLLATAGPHTRVKEIPLQFRTRQAGVSKLDSLVAWEFGLLIADKLIGRWISVRFLSFAAVGSMGILVHFSVLGLLFQVLGVGFLPAQVAGTLAAMTSNFTVNNILTYRDARLRGAAWGRGLIVFALVCSVGAAANVGVAEYLFDRDTAWGFSALAGVLVGTVWNFSVSSVYTWRVGRR